MKRMMTVILGWNAVLVFGIVPNGDATVLNFDTFGGLNWTVIPAGYGGLNWSNFCIENSKDRMDSGYQHGTVSGDFTAFNIYGQPARITGDPFDFNGAYLTGAWNDRLTINVQGFRGGSLIYDTNVIVDSTFPPTFYTFNYVNIDTLRFNSYGGIPHGYFGSGEHFTMDDFTFNSSADVALGVGAGPVGTVLLSLSLSGMALRRLRKT